MVRVLERVRESVLARWGNLLEGTSSGEDPERKPILNFTLTIGDRAVGLADITTRGLYRALLPGVFRRPAAEHTWSTTYLMHNIASIWANTYNWYTAPAVSNADFKFKHRIIFTCGTLHRINPDEYGAGCPVCGGPHEDLQHLMTGCPVVSRFWTG